MKIIMTIVAFILAAGLVLECQAQPPKREDQSLAQRAQRGQGERGPRGQEQRSGRGEKSEQQPGRKGQRMAQGDQRGQRDRLGSPEAIARMLKVFDKDGDEKLNAKELTQLFASIRQRRAGAAQQGDRQRFGRRANELGNERIEGKRHGSRRRGGRDDTGIGGQGVQPIRPE